jgi:hypothetical protein
MAHTTGKARDVPKIRRNKQFETISGYAGLAMVIFIIFLLGGGVYDIINTPAAVLQTSSGSYTSINPYAGEQTINESIVSMFLFGFCIAGLFLAYRSAHVLYDKSKANLYLMIGLSLAIIGFAGAYVMLLLKS